MQAMDKPAARSVWLGHLHGVHHVRVVSELPPSERRPEDRKFLIEVLASDGPAPAGTRLPHVEVCTDPRFATYPLEVGKDYLAVVHAREGMDAGRVRFAEIVTTGAVK